MIDPNFFELPAKLSAYTRPNPDQSIFYRSFSSELDLPLITTLVSPSLSEPYSLSTYRYFVLKHPLSCILGFAYDPSKDTSEGTSIDEKACMVCVVVCICKVDPEDPAITASLPAAPSAPPAAPSKSTISSLSSLKISRPPPSPTPITFSQGYVGMLSVAPTHQRMSLATTSLRLSLAALHTSYSCRTIILEVEASNAGAMRVYEKEGFVREQLCKRYYLNGSDAYRLRLYMDDSKVKDSNVNDNKT